MTLGRIGFAAAITFGVMVASASAVKIDPFLLPYSGAAQHGNAGVGFRIAGKGNEQQMKTFQFSHLVVKCDNGKRHSIAGPVRGHDRMNPKRRFTLEGRGVKNPNERIRVRARKVQGKHEYNGTIAVRSHRKGDGLCRAHTRWSASRG